MTSGKNQHGFTYLTALLLVAVMTTAVAAAVEAWSHARQREKEAELIWIGNQFKQAIGQYYQRSPGTIKRYPQKLNDLIEDRRFVVVQRYLRRVYVDPMTGKTDWQLIRAPMGGIMGVHSASPGSAMRLRDSSLRYVDWKFLYEPPVSRNGLP